MRVPAAVVVLEPSLKSNLNRIESVTGCGLISAVPVLKSNLNRIESDYSRVSRLYNKC